MHALVMNFFLMSLFSFFNLFTWGGMQMWPALIQKAKDGGLDVIQTYVFWNVHAPSPGRVFLNFQSTFFLNNDQFYLKTTGSFL